MITGATAAAKPRWKRPSVHLLVGAAAVAALALPAAALADVLVSAPPTRICLGTGSIKVGVWYQTYSGGPRWFRVSIFDARGARVLYWRGNAIARWRYKAYRPVRVGLYRTVYQTPGGATRFSTRAVICG